MLSNSHHALIRRLARCWLLAALLLGGGLRVLAFELPATSTQCVVGTADNWNSSTVTLRLYQKSNEGWVAEGPAWQGRLGKSGLVWGRGLHPVPDSAPLSDILV